MAPVPRRTPSVTVRRRPVRRRQLVQRLVEGQQVLAGFGGGEEVAVQVDPVGVPAALQAAPPAGALDQDPAHRLGRRREEVTPPRPALCLVPADQPHVGLVDQGRRLEGVPGLLAIQAGGGQLPQLVVDEREQVGGPGLVRHGGSITEKPTDVGPWAFWSSRGSRI